MIIERVSGKPLFEFLRARILTPLGMHSAIDSDHEKWSDADPVGYQHCALGPPRTALLEGAGWLNAAGELAMTAGDIALWDTSLIKGSILKPESLRALTTEVNLKNGARTATPWVSGCRIPTDAGSGLTAEAPRGSPVPT